MRQIPAPSVQPCFMQCWAHAPQQCQDAGDCQHQQYEPELWISLAHWGGWEASQLSQAPLVLTCQEELGQPQTWANSNFRRTDLAAKAT